MSQQQPRTIIIGLGKTGLSCARFLRRRGCEVTVMDTRRTPPELDTLQRELPEVTSVLGGFDAELINQAEMVVVSPGVPLRQPVIAEAVARGVPVIGDIELFARYAKAPVIAVSGSNGKSTVTTLLGEMAAAAGLEVRVGGNIGVPALDLIQDDEPDLYVLELSSFQLETTCNLNAKAAVVLNVSQDHLDRYNDIRDYGQAKRRIFQGDGTIVVNRDDAVVRNWCDPDRTCLFFTLGEPGADHEYGIRQHNNDAWLARGDELLMQVSDLKIAGRHNAANALAALALGSAAGIPMAPMIEVLCRFTGLPHRCQWVAEENGVAWYNDSKATNVGAAIAAITGFEGKVVLIAGGEGKGQDFAPLHLAVASKCRAVILIGRDAPIMKAALEGAAPISFAANLGEAVAQAMVVAQSGDSVLLSPACASFDMFSGFEDRGEQFTAAVMRALA